MGARGVGLWHMQASQHKMQQYAAAVASQKKTENRKLNAAK